MCNMEWLEDYETFSMMLWRNVDLCPLMNIISIKACMKVLNLTTYLCDCSEGRQYAKKHGMALLRTRLLSQ